MDSNSIEIPSTKQQQQQSNCSHVRNICVLAHVDHGKTTLVDCLLASNHIISQRMAGKLRYMDSRPDEQQRGITMKSSSISLVFKYTPTDQKNHLINVIDSPGHVDFFGEVSTALRICDGCVIIVDVIEGVCAQTRAALQQAWLARVRPILVLNKIDRLFVEKKLSPLDIHIQLTQTLEQVNAFIGELFASEVLAKINATLDHHEQQKSSDEKPEQATTTTEKQMSKKQIFYDWSSGLDDIDDSGVYFSPENGNVLFASAIDGWGFTIGDFARILSTKLGFSINTLTKTLWGDFYLNGREKRIQKGAQSKAKKPLFVTFVLENLAKIYEKFLMDHDKLEMIKIAESLNITLETRDLERSDHRQTLMQLFNQWIPLSQSLLRIVCDIVPAPCDINEERVERFITANQTRRFDSLPLQTQMLKQAFLDCRGRQSSDDDNVPLIAYVTKMFSYPQESLPQFRIKPLTREEIVQRREEMMKKKNKNNLAHWTSMKMKILSTKKNRKNGTLRRNDFVYVLGPKHDPTRITTEMIEEIEHGQLTLANLRSDQHVTKVQVKELYLLMGRDLESVDEVNAGHICEPKNPQDIVHLTQALRMLNQSDPCVDVKIQETGEHVIITTGEVHLERCIVDLVNFLGEEIEFNISDPIVPFRETIVEPPKVDTLNEALSDQKLTAITTTSSTTTTNNNCSYNSNKKICEYIEQMTPNKKFIFRIRAKPLPEQVVETLENARDLLIQMMQFERKNVLADDTNVNHQIIVDSNEIFTVDLREEMNKLCKKLEQQFQDANDWPSDTFDKIWSLGPKFYGSNLLINRLKDFNHRKCFPQHQLQQQQQESKCPSNHHDIRYTYENSFINGFQLCTQSGPLCDEPMMGVGFIVEEWKSLEDDHSNDETSTTTSDPFGPISGQIMSTVKEICRRAFQIQPQRLMAAMFSCIIQIDSDALGKMYAVIGRRNGRILHADVQEGSQIFTVNAVLPVIESFNFVNEIRKQTSGKAIPQLSFSHWEVIDLDPFWTPTTEEEYKLYGEKADTENRALRYVNAVRRRKGLHVEEKIVEHAEKQRTLTKNK
ncbi:elongation factor tu gtp-binding domain-containing protein 1-like protein [Dermatophagoides farinae]|uniref:Ribosome assembly protein 1 n=1 Tax=Dermatophagoides farinae TaxID=6954 RepID=A0A9D4NWG1_DERFA|nr:elongation factor tu gtp-binding domain-containing protein 1-like protein [Dermatophagoides farinae]